MIRTAGRKEGSAVVRWARLGALILTLLAAGRIACTYTAFTTVSDEVFHLACGIEWLDRGTYNYSGEQPPLAPVFLSFGPYLAGVRNQAHDEVWKEGEALLYSSSPTKTLTLARLGILPFFLLATGVVWIWSRRLFGEESAFWAVALFTFLPPVLAHAGLATTDMALTACLLFAVYVFSVWLVRRSPARDMLLGLSLGLAVLAKFSTFVFLPVCVATILGSYWVVRRPSVQVLGESLKARIKPLCLVLVAAFLVVWAGYRFSLTPFEARDERPHESVMRLLHLDGLSQQSRLRQLSYAAIETPTPLGTLLRGVNTVRRHNSTGHRTWFMGEYRRGSWRMFFPVTLAVKTPLAFLALYGIGVFAVWKQFRRGRDPSILAPFLCSAATLLAVIPSNINIGVRHVLPIYGFMAVVAGLAVARSFQAKRLTTSVLAAILLLWLALSSLRSHPDYLAYFNELAGDHPERIVIYSDLDWGGQDLLRLPPVLKSLGVTEWSLGLSTRSHVNPFRHNLPPFHLLIPYQPTKGWVAINLQALFFENAARREEEGRQAGPYEWLHQYKPVARAGKTFWIYYIPP